MTFDLVKGHMTYAGWVIDHIDQVSLKSVETARRYIRLFGWQKVDGRTSEKQNTGSCITTELWFIKKHEMIKMEISKWRLEEDGFIYLYRIKSTYLSLEHIYDACICYTMWSMKV